LSKAAIDKRMEQILDFADIGDNIDRPFGMYSSGMKARLGYAVAFNTEPDLFISDEGIAVGDVVFKEKCYAHIRSMPLMGKSVIFVSSSVNKVRKVATEVLIMDQGRMVKHVTDIEEGLEYYRARIAKSHVQTDDDDDDDTPAPRPVAASGKSYPNLELVSVHIPKTGGTSFRVLMKRHYGDTDVAQLDITQKGRARINRQLVTSNELPSFAKVVHGHFSYAELVKRFGVSRSVPVITWLRHPVDRLHSAYAYYRSMIENKNVPVPMYVQDLMRGGTLLSFAEHRRSRNQMTTFLEGLKLEDIFFVGLQEHFETDMMALAQKLGWAGEIGSIRENKTETEKEVLTDDVTARLAELNALDMELYERAVVLRKQRMELKVSQ
jgi:energy-coupling factor transporter ATP-binding protein EcfA2